MRMQGFTALFILLLHAGRSVGQDRLGGSSRPQILLQPDDTFPSDGNLEFFCKATGFPEPRVLWYDASAQRQLTTAQENIHVNQGFGSLTISNPQPRQVYSVYCNVTNTAGWATSAIVHGGLAYLESEFPRFPIDMEAEEDEVVLLECQPPHGYPSPRIEWLVNGSVIPPQWGRISRDGDLHIERAQIHHTGNYSCQAISSAGKRTSNGAMVRVKRRQAYFIQRPKDVHALVGGTAEFQCQTRDKSQVVWRRAPGESPIDAHRSTTSAYSLTLLNVQLPDEGRYVCVSSDGSTAEAQLYITKTAGPAFSVRPVDQTVNEGDTVVFRCRTTGSPEPSIVWDLPAQISIFPTDTFGNIHLNAIGDLEITKVQLNNSGLYLCSAYSAVGAIITNATLRVVPRPSDTSKIPPVINLPPANQTRRVGDTVILDCEVGITREPESNYDFNLRSDDGTRMNVFWVRATRSSGGLQETIDFTHRDRDVRFSLLPGGSLQVIGVMVEDTGNYTCLVQSDYSYPGQFMQSNWTAGLVVLPPGSDSLGALEPSEPLSPPEGLHVRSRTLKSITLHWNPPNVRDDSSVSYWIEMFQTGEPSLGWQVLQESWRPNAIRLEPIQPDVAYYFLIRPRVDDGRIGWASAPLGPIRVQRNPSAEQNSAAARVQGIHVQVMTSNTARVSWNLDKQADPTSGGFQIKYREALLYQCVSALQKDGQFCSLLPSSALQQRIQQFQQQLKTVPIKDTHGISLVPSEAPPTTVLVRNDRSRAATETMLSNLKPFRCYSVNVQPHESYPGYPPDGDALFLTHEDTPGQPPQIIGVKKKSNHSVEVSWTIPPADTWNGLLAGYTVFVFNAAQNEKRELTFSYRETKGVVGGLKAGEVYHIQITARNCRGSSAKSVPVNFSVTESGVVNDGIAANISTLTLQPWIIGIVVGILAIWILAMLFAIIFCRRQRSNQKQRYPHDGPFSESTAGRKCTTTTKDGYHLEPLMKTNSLSTNKNDISTKTQQNTATTIASSNSSSFGGHHNQICNTPQLGMEEIPHCQTSDFSSSPYFAHMASQPMEYPFVDHRTVDTSNHSSFSNSLGDKCSPSTGLPLIAPVAPLNVPRDISSSSVTPYATTSLINAEMHQRAALNSPGSRTPSERSSNPSSGHMPVTAMHSPQRYAFRQAPPPPQQYMSRSSSGTTTGAEEDYLSHHQPRRRATANAGGPQMYPQVQHQPPPTFPEYEMCIPMSQSPPTLPPHLSPSTNGAVNNQVY